MASVFRKPDSQFFYAAYRNASGNRVQKRTKKTKRSDALEVALAFERLEARGRDRTLTEAHARKAVAEILERTTGETLNFFSARAWIAEWLAGKKGVVTDGSFAKYKQVTTDFLTHLGARADLTIAGVSPKDVRSFRDSLIEGGISPSTVNQSIRKVLSAPFTAAQRLGYVPTNPCLAVELLRDDTDAERDVFTPEQVGQLVAAARDDWKGVILIGYFTGLRLRDIANLTWGAVDFQSGTMRVKTGKTGAVLRLPLHAEVSAWLLKEPRGIAKAPIFPKLAGRVTGGLSGLSGHFRAIMEKAGVKGRALRSAGENKGGRNTSSLSFHCLRHSFVSALANAGVAPELRKKLSGHADDRSHSNYTHHELNALRGAVEKIPGLGA